MSESTAFDATKNLLTLGGARLVFHCHHYNISLQRTLDDALGAEVSRALQRDAAARSSHRLLSELFAKEPTEGFEARSRRALELFASLGFGSIEPAALLPEGSEVRLLTSHYALGWRSKFGPAPAPVCHFAVGYLRAALAHAADIAIERVVADECACGAVVEGACVIKVAVHE